MSAPLTRSDSTPDSKALLVKIVCNVCNAKYAVGVDKIAGRAVKMNCKKCSAMIVLRGEAASVVGAHSKSTPTIEADQEELSGEQPKLEAAIANGAPANVTGARSESSVLFTLDKLRGITKNNDIAEVASTSKDQLVLAQGGSSGLIDMKALAEPGNASAVMSRVSVAPSNRRPMSQYAVFGLAFGASVLVAGVAAALVVNSLNSPDQPEAVNIAHPSALLPAAQERPIVAAPAASAAQLATPVQAAAAPAPSAPEVTAPVQEEPAVVAAEEEDRAPRGRRGRHGRHGRHGRGRHVAARTAPRAAHATNSIDALIGQTLSSNARSSSAARPARTAAAPSRGSSLPETPGADAVRAAMNGVRGAVRACGTSQHGLASALVNVSGATGRVSSVNVVGAGTSARACLERAVRGAHMPRFERASFSFRYPLQY